jgi:subtilase family serine protease
MHTTPLVLPGEFAGVVSECGNNGNPPPLVGPEPATLRIAFNVTFMGSSAELALFASEVSDPSNPLYRQYLTPAELTARFGPSECNYQEILDWLKAGDISIDEPYPDHLSIDASGTVAAVESLLHVTLNDYKRPDGTIFFAPDRDPSITLGVDIAISGLDNCFVPEPL